MCTQLREKGECMKSSSENLAGDTKVADNWRELQLVEEETENRLRINRIRK